MTAEPSPKTPPPSPAPHVMSDPEFAGRMTMAFIQGALLPFAALFAWSMRDTVRQAPQPAYAAIQVAMEAFKDAVFGALFGGALFAVGLFASAAALGWTRVSFWRGRAAGFLFVASYAALRTIEPPPFDLRIWQLAAPAAFALVFVSLLPPLGKPQR